MTKFKKQKALSSKFQKKKNSKGRCFIAEKFQSINVGQVVTLYQYFQNLFWNLEIFRRNFDKSCLKDGKIKMSEFQKLYVRRPGNRKHSFFISSIFYQLTNLCSNYTIQLKQMSDICEVLRNWPLKCGFHLILRKKGLSFCGGWVRDLETLNKHLVWC